MKTWQRSFSEQLHQQPSSNGHKAIVSVQTEHGQWLRHFVRKPHPTCKGCKVFCLRKHTQSHKHTHSKICTCWSGSSRTATQPDKQFAQWIHSTLSELSAGQKSGSRKKWSRKKKRPAGFQECRTRGRHKPEAFFNGPGLVQLVQFFFCALKDLMQTLPWIRTKTV